jgi:hypothetical protein
MAKLGSFDDLPPNAQGFLTNYRTRLERMGEAEPKVAAVREAAYYSEMGGAAPEPEPPVRLVGRTLLVAFVIVDVRRGTIASF